MTNNLPSINSFHSIPHRSIFDFYKSLGSGRGTMTPKGPVGTEDLLGARYIISRTYQKDYKYIESVENSAGIAFHFYENQKALPCGFSYDSYMEESEFLQIPRELRAIAMLDSLVVPDDRVQAVKEVLPHFDKEVTLDDYEEAVQNRKKEASIYFEKGKNYFLSNIITDSEKYAFFSVPYDKYWTASVNGIPVEILKSNGLMAVKTQKGMNVIKFTYRYKPLFYCFILTLLGISFFIVYMLVAYKKESVCFSAIGNGFILVYITFIYVMVSIPP